MLIPERKVKVSLSLISSSDGGRSGPVATGYRPNIVFGLSPDDLIRFKSKDGRYFIDGSIRCINSDGIFIFDGNEELYPGCSTFCQMALYRPSNVETFLMKGADYIVREGGIIVGYGSVIEPIQS